MTTANTTQFASMGKEELRAACRAAGISYSKLNNDGMRAALTAYMVEVDAAEAKQFGASQVLADEIGDGDPTDAEIEESNRDQMYAGDPITLEPARVTNPFGAMFGAVVPPTTCGTATKVVDGKKVTSDVKPAKASAPRAPAAPKVPAPVLPKVIRKGYKIQKDREERNGVKKPSEGGLCFAVWAALDAKPGVKASDLQAIADANQWNRNNVLCEFYNWRRFNGVTGRAK